MSPSGSRRRQVLADTDAAQGLSLAGIDVAPLVTPYVSLDQDQN